MTCAPQFGRLFRIKDACPAFAQAAKEYDAAILAGDETKASEIFLRMQWIGQAFWAGVEYGKSHGYLMHMDEVRRERTA